MRVRTALIAISILAFGFLVRNGIYSLPREKAGSTVIHHPFDALASKAWMLAFHLEVVENSGREALII